MKDLPQITITLPACMDDASVRIVRSFATREILCSLEPQKAIPYDSVAGKKYIFIRYQNEYVKIDPDDILYIEADGSYSTLHFVDGTRKTIAFALHVIEQDIAAFPDYVRVHRSFIVNLRHVSSLVGSNLMVKEYPVRIGKEYKEALFGRFVFLGYRRDNKSTPVT